MAEVKANDTNQVEEHSRFENERERNEVAKLDPSSKEFKKLQAMMGNGKNQESKIIVSLFR